MPVHEITQLFTKLEEHEQHAIQRLSSWQPSRSQGADSLHASFDTSQTPFWYPIVEYGCSCSHNLPTAPRAESVASGIMADRNNEEIPTSDQTNTPPSAKDSKEEDKVHSPTEEMAKEDAEDEEIHKEEEDKKMPSQGSGSDGPTTTLGPRSLTESPARPQGLTPHRLRPSPRRIGTSAASLRSRERHSPRSSTSKFEKMAVNAT